jgi:hypothetical protein
MKVSSNFILQDFVHPSVFNSMEDHGLSLLHPELIDSTQNLREHIDVRMILNNWNSGGTFQNRGWRPQASKVGAKNSLHKKGMAIDFHSPDVTMKELFVLVWDARFWIVENTAFRILESFDNTPGWVHIAIGPKEWTEIKVVKP